MSPEDHIEHHDTFKKEGGVEKPKLVVVPSPRLDWCGACKKEHGYDCPQDQYQL